MQLKSNARVICSLLLLGLIGSIWSKPSFTKKDLERALNPNSSRVIKTKKNKKVKDVGLNPRSVLASKIKSPAAKSRAKRKSKRLDRSLYVEQHENPDSEELFSGKLNLDREYQNLIDDHEEMQKKMKKNQASLYKQYREFQGLKKSMKRKRDRKLKEILASATVDNFFHETGKLPKKSSDKILEISDSGLVVKDEVREKKERMLMGMRDLRDLSHLDIPRELADRHRKFQEERKEDFEEEAAKTTFNRPRELGDASASPKKVKQVGSPSFFVRNGHKGQSRRKAAFKPERELGWVERSPARNLKKKPKKKPKKKKKRKSKRQKKVSKLKKKFKKTHKFNWKKLRWEQSTHYRFKLISSVKELKFWRSLGFKIKKSKLKLFNRWNTHRKPNVKQMQCLLTARFGPAKVFLDAQRVLVRGTFSSNCFKYPVDKIFVTRYNKKYVFKINIGPYNYTVAYYNKWRHVGTHVRYQDNLKVFPQFLSKSFNPHTSKKLLWKAGLIPTSGLKWKYRRKDFFDRYQHAYQLRTYKQGLLYRNILKRKKWLREKRRRDEMNRLRNSNRRMHMQAARRRREAERRRREAARRRQMAARRRRPRRRRPSRRRRRRRRRGRRRMLTDVDHKKPEKKRERKLGEVQAADEQVASDQERELAIKTKEIIKASDFARESKDGKILASKNIDSSKPERELRRRRTRRRKSRSSRTSRKNNRRKSPTKMRKSHKKNRGNTKSLKKRKLRLRRRRRRNHRRNHHHHRRNHHHRHRHHRHRRRPVNHRMKMLTGGYAHYGNRGREFILSASPYKPLVPYRILKILWDSSDKISTCKPTHVHLCNV